MNRAEAHRVVRGPIIDVRLSVCDTSGNFRYLEISTCIFSALPPAPTLLSVRQSVSDTSRMDLYFLGSTSGPYVIVRLSVCESVSYFRADRMDSRTVQKNILSASSVRSIRFLFLQ